MLTIASRLQDLRAEKDLTRARALLIQDAGAASVFVYRCADATTPERIDELLADYDRIREMCLALKAKL